MGAWARADEVAAMDARRIEVVLMSLVLVCASESNRMGRVGPRSTTMDEVQRSRHPLAGSMFVG